VSIISSPGASRMAQCLLNMASKALGGLFKTETGSGTAGVLRAISRLL